ncbi:guanosine-5'-triphosphate,3'-diphosphate pyrophosphatase [Colwellia sp. 1_MG-2023]|uniref:Ppx/GppA phosphatase family protein n=1 Tax=Colwellia sp. 1_MG-2023 TaxID=3062649 RepID=UPI0026E1BF7F|nr:guanosine-5'-triphosphate,3'-diphosphate pyrophosphatase [Colwellia sp. 1_MG-2023]MDO6445243.1 guanosine-5'-triphosphate,3'-diphosphate pyrophosphatase [Colwellia sp. 1_MG-2023]
MISNNPTDSPLYAIIDLGSNSFHMMITRQLADSVQVVDKVKRKVRLAAGLNSDNILSEEAMARGLECLSFFAERLQDIPTENVRIVATATLRLAQNSQDFIHRANKVLGQAIKLISGEQEAELIYLGVAHTSCCQEKRFVIDIGGASTELVVGTGFQPQKITSLDIGCVTFNRQFFADGLLTQVNFDQAIAAAKKILLPLIAPYSSIGWQSVLGGSGTMQALAEVLLFQNRPSIISYHFLKEIQQQLIANQSVNNINIAGLTSERTPVIASGLSILIAIFESFAIEQLQLSCGALREGLLYEMLPCNKKVSIRKRTALSLMHRYHVDEQHAYRVKAQVASLFQSLSPAWQLHKDNSYELLLISCDLHEIGLLLEFKHHQKHSAYIIENAELPGFDQADRQLLKAFVKLYKGDIDVSLLKQSVTDPQTASYLLAILRLSIILCRLRKDDVLPHYQSSVDENNQINLCLPKDWLAEHPLIADELVAEEKHLAMLGLSVNIQCNI